MMNKFEKQLEKWNGGVLRGAQAKLAKLLHVSTATVALWATGKRRPSKGYAAQMAQLFGMDAYDVIRLFPANTTYPELQPPHRPRSLRDAQAPENTYRADYTSCNPGDSFSLSNSVSLPFLENAPENYPNYQDGDVAEWWTVPRHHAKGAKFLVCDPADKETLFFIRPEKDWQDGQVMFIQTPRGYVIKRVQIQSGGITLWQKNNAPYNEFPLHLLQPIGTVVRKITGV